MSLNLLTGKKAPYCPGCGHNSVNTALAKVFSKLDLDPLNVTLISDIGCCGLVDGLLNCHTIHGLHGRSTALALGVRLGLNDPEHKVLVIMGDGGATIGLQHVLEAARQNIDITLILLNNMVYGMTGGQISGLSPSEFKETKMPEARDIPPYDICELAFRAGGSYCARVFVSKELPNVIEAAVRTKGFSLVEIVEMCPSYGAKKVTELKQLADHQEVILTRERAVHKALTHQRDSLFSSLPVFEIQFEPHLETRLEVIIAGSAGEGIQSAGDLLSCAGVASGLNTTKKGEYPVTVGSGFSIAEVICSREDIDFTGIETPDILFILSEDGYQIVKSRISPNVTLIVDTKLGIPFEGKMLMGDFQKLAGKKGAALCAIAAWLHREELFPVEALVHAAKEHKHADSLIASIEAGMSADLDQYTIILNEADEEKRC